MSRNERDPNCTLIVRNLADGASSDELKDLFKEFGNIKDVYIPLDYYTRRQRGFAYVQFDDPRDAKDALNDLDGNKYLDQEMRIDIARGDRKTPSEMKSKQRGGRYDRRRDYGDRRGRRHYDDSDDDYRRRDRSRSRSRNRRRRSRSASRSASPCRRKRYESPALPKRSPRREQSRSPSRSASPCRRKRYESPASPKKSFRRERSRSDSRRKRRRCESPEESMKSSKKVRSRTNSRESRKVRSRTNSRESTSPEKRLEEIKPNKNSPVFPEKVTSPTVEDCEKSPSRSRKRERSTSTRSNSSSGSRS